MNAHDARNHDGDARLISGRRCHFVSLSPAPSPSRPCVGPPAPASCLLSQAVASGSLQPCASQGRRGHCCFFVRLLAAHRQAFGKMPKSSHGEQRDLAPHWLASWHGYRTAWPTNLTVELRNIWPLICTCASSCQLEELPCGTIGICEGACISSATVPAGGPCKRPSPAKALCAC